MNKKLIISIALIILSVGALLLFRANFGIDFADASLTIVATENVNFGSDALNDANKLKNITRVEQVSTNQLYLYFQPITDNSYLTDLSGYIDRYKLSQSESYMYRFPSEEFTLITNRAVTLGLAIMLIMFIFVGAELRGQNWKRWQVGYSIVTDFFISFGVIVLIGGVLAVFAELGLKMENEFVSYVMVCVGITGLFRLYEINIFKRTRINDNGKLDKNEMLLVFKNRKPELILLSCVLLLAGFMPLVVLGGKLTILSLLVFLSIGVNYLVAVYIKPGFLTFMFEQGENTRMLKKKAFEKIW